MSLPCDRRSNVFTILTLLTLQMMQDVLSAAHRGVHRHLLLCVSSIANRYFAPGRPVVTSTPSSLHDVTEYGLLPLNNEIQFVNAMMKNLHKQSKWPLLSLQPEKPITESNIPYRHQSYIITLWPDQDGDVLDSVQQQIENLLYDTSFNHRATFILVVMDLNIQIPQLHTMNMVETIWKQHKIINVLILVPNASRLHREACSDCTQGAIDLYTWFPYHSGKCGQVTEVHLLDQWLLQGNGSFRHNADLFPTKVPRNMHGCPLTIAPVEQIPYVKFKNNYTDTHDNVIYKFEGLEIEYLLILCKAMNITPVFLQPRVGDFLQKRMQIFAEIARGTVDMTVGTHPLHPLLSVGDPVGPYYELQMRWWIPCASPAQRMEKLLAVFAPSVWLSLLLVFVLTTVAFWRTAVGISSASSRDANIYKTIPRTFYNVLAIFFGVSVPDMPKTARLRSVFLLYVWYSFAMGTVFQAFFVSFLVSPGYEKGIETYEELMNSGLTLATDARIEGFVNLTGLREYFKLELSTDTCFDVHECLIQLVRYKNVTTVTSQLQTEYVLAKLGITKDGNDYVCTIPEIIVTAYIAAYVSKGNPLLDRFNSWTQRAIESGLIKKYWSQFIYNVSLQGRATFVQDDTEGKQTGSGEGGDMFFVFTVSHLSVAFYQLLIGYLFCLIIFTAECICCKKKGK